MGQSWPTTLDNPFNPFTHEGEWLEYDLMHGYNTLGLWAYFSEASVLMDDEEYDYEAELAMDRLIDFNPFGRHYRLFESNADEVIRIANETFRSLPESER